jgi:hypothetical protein
LLYNTPQGTPHANRKEKRRNPLENHKSHAERISIPKGESQKFSRGARLEALALVHSYSGYARLRK